MRLALATICLLALSGCATSFAYRADYLPEMSIAEDSRIEGRVLVCTTRADDERLVTAGATSFTGSAAKLTTPVGMIARESPSRCSRARHVTGPSPRTNSRISDVTR